LAAELHRTTREVAACGFDRIDPERDIRIVLIEAAERILPELPERISAGASRLLDEMGIKVRTGARATEVAANGLRLSDGSFIPSELVVWAAGVKAPDVLQQLDGLQVNRITQLVVEPTLQTTRDPDIFAIGDCAACPRPWSRHQCRRGHRPRTKRLRICYAKSSAGCAVSRCVPTHTGISARLFRSVNTAQWGI
jgi:NADH dehydrogenase